MLVKDFSFELPPELIAQYPSQARQDCRLLVIDRRTGQYTDAKMEDFVNYLEPGSVVVINNTRVRKARVYGVADTGAKVQFLFTGQNPDGTLLAMTTKGKRQKPGKTFAFSDSDGRPYATGTVLGENEEGLKIVSLSVPVTEEFFERCGHVPLPPYIRREDEFSDEDRYQTVYASVNGSVAAPTAGLHYTPQMLDEIRAKGIEIVEITLHVGMGTFLPMRSETLEGHHMHFESYHVLPQAAEAINRAKSEGRMVVATGTTSVRTLESAWVPGEGVRPGYGRTDLFITPGFEFHVVDQLLTNFHTPESTLLVLVSAFSSREIILNAYRHAVEERYRFFSYGDATFIK